jgi:hypothetical protein
MTTERLHIGYINKMNNCWRMQQFESLAVSFEHALHKYSLAQCSICNCTVASLPSPSTLLFNTNLTTPNIPPHTHPFLAVGLPAKAQPFKQAGDSCSGMQRRPGLVLECRIPHVHSLCAHISSSGKYWKTGLVVWHLQPADDAAIALDKLMKSSSSSCCCSCVGFEYLGLVCSVRPVPVLSH